MESTSASDSRYRQVRQVERTRYQSRVESNRRAGLQSITTGCGVPTMSTTRRKTVACFVCLTTYTTSLVVLCLACACLFHVLYSRLYTTHSGTFYILRIRSPQLRLFPLQLKIKKRNPCVCSLFIFNL